MRKRGLEDAAKAAQAVYVAQNILDAELPQLKGMLTVQKLSHTELIVAADHSIASQECQMHVPSLLSGLKEQLGEGVVREIRIVRK